MHSQRPDELKILRLLRKLQAKCDKTRRTTRSHGSENDRHFAFRILAILSKYSHLPVVFNLHNLQSNSNLPNSYTVKLSERVIGYWV